MALQAFVYSTSGSGIIGALGDIDDAFVAQGVAIASSDNIGLQATGSNQRIDVFGTVVGGFRAITMGDDATTDSAQMLSIAKTGHVAGYGWGLFAVRLDAGGSTLVNKGSIAGKDLGVTLGGFQVGALATINNSGTIEASAVAVQHYGTENFLLKNSGSILGDIYSDTGEDRVDNTGTIEGNVFLEGGNDRFDTRAGTLIGAVDGGAGNDTIYGSNANDEIHGNADADDLFGGNGDDLLFGGTGDDYLSGSYGNDRLTGGLGIDELRGGAGADKFIYSTINDSTRTPEGRDRILDFTKAQLDKIDLSAIDAKFSTVIDNAFTFIGKGSYTDTEGQLRYTTDGGITSIYGDIDGDSKSDFAIWLNGTYTLSASDFIL